MNVTPLIDVLLVLIIVFMVVVSMSNEKGVEAQIPQQSNDPPSVTQPDTGTIVVQVMWAAKDQEPKLRINQEEVSWDALQPRLHDIFKLRANKVAFVKGDDDIDFEYVARGAGVDKVGLMTKAQAAER
jgi:biopolymer transport protein ExbD